MIFHRVSLLFFTAIYTNVLANIFSTISPEDGDYRQLYPKICIAQAFIKQSYIISYSLGFIENLRYPKDRIHIALFISPDKNTEAAAEVWADKMKRMYLSIVVEEDITNWMEDSLRWGRAKACDFLLLTNEDNFLKATAIKDLVSLKLVAVSPLMNDPNNKYSNVYELLGSSFINRQNIGTQQVYYLNLPIFINLKSMDSSYLTFDSGNVRDYELQSNDPFQILAHSAYTMNISLFFDNKHFYGHIINSNLYSLENHKSLLGYFLSQHISKNGHFGLPYTNFIEPWYPSLSSFGFDKIFVINLKCRQEKLHLINMTMNILGISYEVVEAVDPRILTAKNLPEFNYFSGMEDSDETKSTKKAEGGHLLSHYRIWQDMIKRKYERILILEDDITFNENATTELKSVVEDIEKTNLAWDIICLGRSNQRKKTEKEFIVEGHRYLFAPANLCGTSGYALSYNGAQKLVQADPSKNMPALDDFLETMSDKYPNKQWSNYFNSRNLKVYGINPAMISMNKYAQNDEIFMDGICSSTKNIGLKMNSKNMEQTDRLQQHTEKIAKNEL